MLEELKMLLSWLGLQNLQVGSRVRNLYQLFVVCAR